MSEELQRKIASRKFIVTVLTIAATLVAELCKAPLPWHFYALIGTYLTGQSILDWKIGK